MSINNRSRFTAKRLALNAAMVALYFALSMLAISIGGFKLTFEHLPVIICAVMFGRQIEYCYLMILDKKGKLMACPLMQTGTIDRSAVYAREVALKALRGKAVYCVLSHNHPGGHMEPSREDIQMTYSVKDALNAVGITLLDHIIVSDDKAISIRSLGFPPEKVWQNQKKTDKLTENWFASS